MNAVLRSRAFVVTGLVLAALAANGLWRGIEARRLMTESGLDAATGPQAIVVELSVRPEQFHMKRLQARGTMVGAEGNAVRLRGVSPDAVRAIAGEAWVDRIRRLDP